MEKSEKEKNKITPPRCNNFTCHARSHCRLYRDITYREIDWGEYEFRTFNCEQERCYSSDKFRIVTDKLDQFHSKRKRKTDDTL